MNFVFLLIMVHFSNSLVLVLYRKRIMDIAHSLLLKVCSFRGAMLYPVRFILSSLHLCYKYANSFKAFSLWECLFVPPVYSNLRIFGCTWLVLLQSSLIVFIGYSTEHKGCGCYDHLVHRLHISRYVHFFGDIVFSYSRCQRFPPSMVDVFS